MDLIASITIGNLLKQLVPESVECIISTFLAEDPEERRGNEEYKTMFETLYTATKKGKKRKFDRYCKNLKYDAFGVYSYDTEVISLNWKHRTAKRLGRWSPTTSRHMNYAIQMLKMCYDFTEIKYLFLF